MLVNGINIPKLYFSEEVMSKLFNALKVAAKFGQKHMIMAAGVAVAGITAIGLGVVGKMCGLTDEQETDSVDKAIEGEMTVNEVTEENETEEDEEA
jgi:hypothetical protein